MTSMVFRIDIVFLYDIDGFSHRYRIRYYINGFSHRYLIRHQWFFTEILYFYVTSMVCPIDIVFIYDIAGFSHRYRMPSMILPIGFSHRYRIFICHLLVFPIDIVFLYDINGFSHRYVIRHQWFFTEILYFYMTSMVFP